ncbi:MAG: hypothetical protein CL816_06800 [Coxiellaceae bacterium]|nr:hypothetical protein [Coxiellaceae bacterium]|tara:strand:+ start:12088 stop:12546 length:459 start_codon:yes stop_codon:yes gene_type:complete
MAFVFSGWNVVKWVSLDTLKNDTNTVADLYKSAVPSSSAATDGDYGNNQQSWDELVARVGLTEEQLRKRISTAKKMVKVFLILGFSLMGYSLYLFKSFPLMSGMVSLVFSLLMFANAFREHRFIFNCEHRMINSTIIQWFSGSFFPNKKHTK